MMEVQAGQLASTKASDPQVKTFAETLVKDHTAANDELIKLANSKHVELPPGPSHGERKDIDKLGKQSGAAFDKEFVSMGVKDHRKDVKDFEKASGKAKDPELKAWIDKTLPKLREHLAMAEKLRAVDRQFQRHGQSRRHQVRSRHRNAQGRGHWHQHRKQDRQLTRAAEPPSYAATGRIPTRGGR